MENGKASPGRRIFNGVLIILDLALLVWIVLAWRGRNKPVSTEDYYGGLGYDMSSVVSSSEGTDDSPLAGTSASGGITNASLEDSSGGNADSWFRDSSDEEGSPSGQTAAVSYEAAGRPEIGEFDGWEIPAGAGAVTDFSAVSGSWKGFIRYDVAEELVSFTVSGSASSLTLTVDWYLIHYFGDGSWENEEDMEDAAYTGSWSDGVLSAAGAGSFTIDSFCEANGRQYAKGTLTTPTGAAASVSMMRP